MRPTRGASLAAVPLLISHLVALRASALVADKGRCGDSLMDFSEFVEKFAKPYEVGSDEYLKREDVYSKRVQQILRHNCDPAGPWFAGVNHLSDWTPEELATLHGHRSLRRSGSVSSFLGVSGYSHSVDEKKRFAKAFSWKNLSAIKAPSVDQGGCGSCWAHASRLSLKSRAEIKGLERQTDWATDQIVACAPNPRHCGGGGGCYGATAELAYEYVLNAGLLQDGEYKMLAMESTGDGKKCPPSLQVESEFATKAIVGRLNSELHRAGKELPGRRVGLQGWAKLPENKEAPVMHELMVNGPLYVAVAAGKMWFDYDSGILTQESCDADSVLNHAIVLFAWGRKGTKSYWQIKNSWGATWGEVGTARLLRTNDQEKECHWDRKPQEGSGCDGGPEKVLVCGTCGILYDAVAAHF